jgi:hypothetical protein
MMFFTSIIGISAALQLGIREDTGLLMSGIAGTVLLLKRTPIGARPAAA